MFELKVADFLVSQQFIVLRPARPDKPNQNQYGQFKPLQEGRQAGGHTVPKGLNLPGTVQKEDSCLRTGQ